MDVMRDHDIKVTFHLEPYRDDRSRSYADDLLFLLREYGEKRHWDTFLLLDEGNGRVAPVFKSFRTILPSEVQDCLGRIVAVPDYTSDGDWRRQTDVAREQTRRDFSRLYLLADSLDVGRTGASGFDGLAVYDNFVTPSQWPRIAQDATDVGLLYSFNVNPGFDRYPERQPPPPPEVDPCYGGPLGFEPGGTHPDWSRAEARRTAQDLALGRITESFVATTSLQRQVGSSNSDRGFFLSYVNSFNEWHEGSQFEPARDDTDLTPDERRVGYHNPPDGMARLRHLRTLVDGLGPWLQPGAGSVNPDESRPDLADPHLQRALDALNVASHALSTEGWLRAAPGHWNSAQIVEHLGKAFGSTAYILDKCVTDGAPKARTPVVAAAAVHRAGRGGGLLPHWRPRP